MPRKRKEEVTIEPGKGLNLDPELIKQLVPGTLEVSGISCVRQVEIQIPMLNRSG